MSNIDFRLKCWYEAGCNLKTDFCEKTCHRYLQMNYLINNCGMKNADRFLKPISPAKIDVDAYLQLQEIKDILSINKIAAYQEQNINRIRKYITKRFDVY